MSRYTEHLRSAYWFDLRQQVLTVQTPPRCYFCRCKASIRRPLELHHLTYERLGAERISDVALACLICHGMVHFLEKQGRSLGDANAIVREMRSGPNRQPKPAWAPRRKNRLTRQQGQMLRESRGRQKWEAFKTKVAAQSLAAP